MSVTFESENQARMFGALVKEFRALRYSDALLVPDGYEFGDWFQPAVPSRKIGAAAFGQTPISYDTACFGIALSNGFQGKELVNRYRALGAPVIFEVTNEDVVQWEVAADEEKTVATARISPSEISRVFADHATDWAPREFLRSKAIGVERRSYQQSLFAGLIPELETSIRDALDPILRSALSAAIRTYVIHRDSDPDETQLFRLAFSILTAKVFHDREHPDFRDLNSDSDPGEVVRRVASHYGESWRPPLTVATRQVTFDAIWQKMDFRNLSVDVLSHIWSHTLVTGALRKRLGIHRTPRSIVRYIIDRIPFDRIPESERVVVEPCCGSAVFLVAALNKMRDLMDPTTGPEERHVYFQRMLHGFERDPAGVEISRLCLALSDYPNANGWVVKPGDVFTDQSFRDTLAKARVVLCNPPFEDVPVSERIPSRGIRPPLHMLEIVLENLHPDGVLGFVLPRVFIDGDGYKAVRKQIASRFADVELVTLPDKGWEHADKETVLLVAKEARRKSGITYVTHRKVRENAWQAFDLFHHVSSEDSGERSPADAEKRLSIPDLGKVWHHLRHLATLKDVASVHRGIEWNQKLIDPTTRKETGWRERLVQATHFPDSKLGVPPKSKPFFAFEVPPTAYLDVSEMHKLYDAHSLDWHKPKVVLNAKTKSRGPWRMAAFADTSGLVVYQTFTAVWPKDPADLSLLAALLNGPVANAFVATREGKTDITNDTIEDIPVPEASVAERTEIDGLVRAYVDNVNSARDEILSHRFQKEATAILMALDAVVLRCYDLPPRLERSLLDYFRGQRRTSRFEFPQYFPPDFKPCVSLKEYLSDEFRSATAGEFRRAFEEATPAVLDALRKALNAFGS